MRLIEMYKLESPPGDQTAHGTSSPGAQAKLRSLMNRDPGFRDAIRKRRIPRRQQLDLMPALAQSTERQQCLALPAAPFPLQIPVKHPPGVRAPPARRPAARTP